jgi:hypothetical protein
MKRLGMADLYVLVGVVLMTVAAWMVHPAAGVGVCGALCVLVGIGTTRSKQ